MESSLTTHENVLSSEEQNILNLVQGEYIVSNCKIEAHNYILTNKRLFLNMTSEDRLFQIPIKELSVAKTSRQKVNVPHLDEVYSRAHSTGVVIALLTCFLCITIFIGGAVENGLLVGLFKALFFGIPSGLALGVTIGGILYFYRKQKIQQVDVVQLEIPSNNVMFSNFQYGLEHHPEIVKFESKINSLILG